MQYCSLARDPCSLYLTVHSEFLVELLDSVCAGRHTPDFFPSVIEGMQVHTYHIFSQVHQQLRPMLPIDETDKSVSGSGRRSGLLDSVRYSLQILHTLPA